jgi:hypothetical protein
MIGFNSTMSMAFQFAFQKGCGWSSLASLLESIRYGLTSLKALAG